MASVKLNSNGLNNNNNNHSGSGSRAASSSSSSSSRSSNNSSPSLAGSGSNSPAATEAAADCQMDTSTTTTTATANECGNANPPSTAMDLHTSTAAATAAVGGGIEWIGSSCGHYGPYTFYKAVKLSRPRRRILAMGDFFLVKPWSDQEIVSIGEIQLLWEDDKASTNGHRTPLVSVKLYFLPENTPEGRHEEHGEDEVVSISEKVVLKVADLATWIVDDVKWERGSPSVWDRHCSSSPTGSTAPRSPRTPTTPPKEGAAAAEEAETSVNAASPPVATATAIAAAGPLDMCDVIKEKQVIAIDDENSSNVLVLSYPAYCRYRSTLKRLEGHSHTEYMRQAVVEAIGGRAAPTPNTRVVFCKDTFDYPELEDHELLCNHLAPKWKGRPRKMRKKRSHSPGSESNESESSVSTGTSSYRSKDSPMKPHGIRNVPAPYRPGDRPKGEQIFMQKLNKFMAGRGTPIGRLPSLGFKQLDLFLFYVKVQRAGGYEAAVANKLWKGIYMELGGHPSNTSAATCTRRHYEKLLLPYERHVEEMSSSNTSPVAATAAATPTTGGGGGGSGTPPKKRKLSSTMDVFADFEERLRAEASSSNLTLQELMTAGDPANLLAAATSDSKALSALSDLARIAHQLDGNRPSVIQKNVIDAHKSHMGSSSVAGSGFSNSNGIAAHSKSMAHSMSASSTSLGPPPPAHSQKPVTLPSVNAAAAAGAGSATELCQWYTQMLSDGTSKTNGGNPLGAAAVLELALRPPTPAAATPSIFVPSRRIYVDPTLDVKKTRLSSGSVGSPAVHNPSSSSGIQSAHASRPTNSKIPGLNPIGPSSSSFHSVTPPRPAAASAPSVAHQLNHSTPSRTAAPQSHMLPSPAASHRSSIPLVDLTSRSVNPIKSESESSLTGKPKQELVNGKSLMDLSAQPLLHHNHNHHKFSSGSAGVSLPLHSGTAKPWNSSRDVSISLNVKIEGSGAEAPSAGYKSSGVMGNSSSHLHHQQQQQRNSHSVTVVPLVKEDLSSIQQLARRKEKEAMRADRISVTAQHHHSSSSSSSHSQQQLQQQQQQQQSYPRMVDSLVAINNASSAAAGVSSAKSGSTFTSASHYSGGGGSSSSSGSKSVSTSSSGSTAAVVAAAAAASSGLQHAPMYAGMLDPALASYYSSLYATPHMYGLPPGAFMAAASGAPGMHHSSMFHPNHHHHAQHQMSPSSAAAEVTAQVYKEMVQRGYPPALAPGLPPGLSGLPGLSSLGSFAASMYSSLGGAAKADHANTAERSLPKS